MNFNLVLNISRKPVQTRFRSGVRAYGTSNLLKNNRKNHYSKTVKFSNCTPNFSYIYNQLDLFSIISNQSFRNYQTLEFKFALISSIPFLTIYSRQHNIVSDSNLEPHRKIKSISKQMLAFQDRTQTSKLNLKALEILSNAPISLDMIQKLVVGTLQVLPCQEELKYPSPPLSPGAGAASQKGPQLPLLRTFLTKLIRYTNVYTGTLLATLVYLNKLKNKLPKNAQGLPCTRHRILLSCLILASKNLNDSSPKNIHWAKYTDGLFSVKDINLMERQLLFLLDWDLTVTNEDLIIHLGKFLNPIKQELIDSAKMRLYLKKQQEKQQKIAHHERMMEREKQGRMTRSSSNSSSLSLYSRSDSVSSASSYTSAESSPTTPHKGHITKHYNLHIPDSIDPRIEMAALNETRELNNLIEQLLRGTTASVY